jgi:hypothetical protein
MPPSGLTEVTGDFAQRFMDEREATLGLHIAQYGRTALFDTALCSTTATQGKDPQLSSDKKSRRVAGSTHKPLLS